ncbi:MAG: hypothetical protein ACYTEL_11050 [Planctomycetota bacterium]|jgi:pimeloyl-CoA synthetase
MIPDDTSIDAAVRQIEILRRIGMEGRARMTFELSDNMRKTLEAGVRHRHPDWNDGQVNREVVRLMLGDRLFREVFGGAEGA